MAERGHSSLNETVAVIVADKRDCIDYRVMSNKLWCLQFLGTKKEDRRCENFRVTHKCGVNILELLAQRRYLV